MAGGVVLKRNGCFSIIEDYRFVHIAIKIVIRIQVIHLKEIQYLLEVIIYATLPFLFALGGDNCNLVTKKIFCVLGLWLCSFTSKSFRRFKMAPSTSSNFLTFRFFSGGWGVFNGVDGDSSVSCKTSGGSSVVLFVSL